MDAYLDWALSRARGVLGDREVTVVDLGCGSGFVYDALVRAGYRGSYVGVDIRRHPAWRDDDAALLRRRLVVADVHEIEPGMLPTADLVVSVTSLEHIRDDALAVRTLTGALAPGGVQVHLVPAEDGLNLWREHGWRQYSPACLAELFPQGEIFRIGGAASSMVHRAFITPVLRGGVDRRETMPRAYAIARRASLMLDRWTGHSPASVYGVFCPPTRAGTVETRRAA